MKRFLCLAVAAIVGMALIPNATLGAAPFYEGKTIRIMVGVSAGGGFDNEARILARHMPKYIPGKPTIIVENVTGAGGLICANQLYKATHRTASRLATSTAVFFFPRPWSSRGSSSMPGNSGISVVSPWRMLCSG